MALAYLLIFAVYLLVLVLLKRMRKPKNFPPGPPRLPLVGSVPFLHGGGESFSLLHGVRKAREKYGDVMGFYLGGAPAAVISDFDTLVELFKEDSITSRPPIAPFNENRLGWDNKKALGDSKGVGIIMSDGDYWRDQRRFTLRTLRDFGFGKTSMESRIVAEADKLCDSYEQNHVGKGPACFHSTVSISILNSLWSIVVGENLPLDDPKLKSVVQAVNDVVRDQGPQSPLAAVLPDPSWIKHPLLAEVSGFNKNRDMFRKVTQLVTSNIAAHESEFDPNSNCSDFVDAYLAEIDRTRDTSSSFHAANGGRESLVNTVVDLFIVGSETTSTTLLWTMLYLLHHEDVQARVHWEIEKVIGSERDPSFSDRSSMPLTHAVVTESLRMTSFASLGIPHFTSASTSVSGGKEGGPGGKGFSLPKGTTVFANLYHVMNDPAHWEEPRSFRPDRFIDQLTGEFIHNERVIPFGVGRRACPGKLLAEQELFLFTVKLMQRFSLRPHADHPLPSYAVDADCPTGITRPCPEFRAVLERRQGQGRRDSGDSGIAV